MAASGARGLGAQLRRSSGHRKLLFNLPAHHGESGQRRHRQGHRQREQDLPHAAVPGRQAQPVVHADAAMHPHAHEQRRMLQRQSRPDVGQLEGIAVIGASKACRPAVEHSMRDEEQRNGKPAGDLRGLPEGNRQVRRRESL